MSHVITSNVFNGPPFWSPKGIIMVPAWPGYGFNQTRFVQACLAQVLSRYAVPGHPMTGDAAGSEYLGTPGRRLPTYPGGSRLLPGRLVPPRERDENGDEPYHDHAQDFLLSQPSFNATPLLPGKDCRPPSGLSCLCLRRSSRLLSSPDGGPGAVAAAR